MYLSKLEIFGFKSFANKTIISFDKGITGIVGPNGCGKTNIVDGIRWVLGEQKSSVLRSDKMENVIFNGTRDKKPMGMAEISLTLVNDDNVLPTEYTEVTITRRIFRSGESEYLLNKNICRLKDITNLFMDTGMGTNAYSVIELKMVETILSNKADERRHMFEEAAGVNKYKLRRRLTLKRLDDVKGDLVRVNDIVSEVEKNVRSLHRQAKKANKYNQLQSLLREKELDLADREFSSSSSRLNQLVEYQKESNDKKEEVDVDIRKIENQLILFRESISSIENELSEKRIMLSVNTDKLYEVQKNISVAEEREKVLNRNIDNYKTELEELDVQQIENDELLENNKLKIVDIKEQIDQKNLVIEQNEQVLVEKKQSLDLQRDEVKAKSEKVSNIEKEISTLDNKINNAKDALDKTNNEVEKLNTFIQETTNNIAKTVGYLEELGLEKADVQRKVEISDSEYVQKQKEKETLEKELNNLREKELDEKNLLNGLKNKIELLHSLITNLEGVSEGSKVLIENESWSKKEKTLFADVGNTDEKYRLALDASLKTVLNNILIEQIDDLKNAIKYLKENNFGKASFYLLELPANGSNGILKKVNDFNLGRRIKKLEREDSFIGWAFEFVKTNDKWKPFFRKLLSNVVVTKDIDSALKLHLKYPSFSFTTIDGDLVQNNGIIEAGSSPKLDDTLFGRKQMLEDLKKEFPKYEQNIHKLSMLVSETEEKIASIDLKDLSDRGRTLLNEINNIEKQISQFEFEKNRSSDEIEKAQEQIHSFVNEAGKLNRSLDEFSDELSRIIEAEEEAKVELINSEQKLKEVEEVYNESLNFYNQNKLELERLLGQLQNTQNVITRADENRNKIINSVDKRKKDIQITNDELDSLKVVVNDNQSDHDELSGVKNTLLNEEDNIKQKLNSKKEESSILERNVNSLRNERQQISDDIHEVDIKTNEIKIRLENLVEHIKEEYSIDLQFKEIDNLEDFDFNYHSEEVHRLKHQLKGLGPVNLLAYSEYEEENERLEFLQKQRDDLVKSQKDLVNTIDEINEVAEKLFVETFGKIKENFKDIFRTLFDPGDEADLILQEGVDPLEAKIEIIAKPKGKRPTSIELLSGGEKTLTATALLFAIYLVKPSPFCVLDEVDAPLDDANIDRFTRLLNEFSKNTQFIIVTHNKRTMTSSETMYGVTMQDEGISKLAGVKFTDEIKTEN